MTAETVSALATGIFAIPFLLFSALSGAWADRFSKQTRRAYQVEYVLLGGVNDSLEDAAELATALKGRRLHVSVIRWNPVEGMEFQTPSLEAARAFVTVLHQADVSAQLRRTVGQESAAACGQLRASRIGK